MKWKRTFAMREKHFRKFQFPCVAHENLRGLAMMYKCGTIYIHCHKCDDIEA